MTRRLLIAGLVCLMGLPAVGQITGELVLVETDVPTIDPSLFGPGRVVDVWHVLLTNRGAVDATSLELDFPGPWLNPVQDGLRFKDSPGLPTFGADLVADSFFVLLPGTSPVEVCDCDQELVSTYTVAGDTALVPAGGEPAVVAVAVAPAGEVINPAAISRGFTGRAAVAGQPQPITFVPEPTAAALATLAVAAVGCRRPRRLQPFPVTHS